MNSSVTWESATSVMSSLCLEMSASSRSNGPSNTSRCTWNPPVPPSSAAPGGPGGAERRPPGLALRAAAKPAEGWRAGSAAPAASSMTFALTGYDGSRTRGHARNASHRLPHVRRHDAHGRISLRVLVAIVQAARQQAGVALRLQVGEQHGDRLPDQAAPVHGDPVPAQGQPRALEFEQLVGGQVDSDLLSVPLTPAGLTLAIDDGTGTGGTEQLRDSRQAHPPGPGPACRHRSSTSLASSR